MESEEHTPCVSVLVASGAAVWAASLILRLTSGRRRRCCSVLLSLVHSSHCPGLSPVTADAFRSNEDIEQRATVCCSQPVLLCWQKSETRTHSLKNQHSYEETETITSRNLWKNWNRTKQPDTFHVRSFCASHKKKKKKLPQKTVQHSPCFGAQMIRYFDRVCVV